ncbi:MAG: exosortase O [Chloroflexi bacterium]|nr:exosortase O [Chloroflexota bacterium]
MVQHKHSDGDILLGYSHFQVSRTIWLLCNVAIVCLWLWLFRPVYDNLITIFTREDFRTNQIALIGVVVLIGLRIRRERGHPRLDTPPHLVAPALVLTAGGAVLFVAVERFLDVNIIAMGLFGLASYGLLGLWLPPRAWRAGLPAAMLLVGTLPLGDFVDVFIGYPVRTATATLVRNGLSAAGVASIGVDTILVFENGISQVDLPCSGVKSLWTGMLFLIAATWVERRSFTWRWVFTALAFVALLFIANFTRVAILVTIGQVLGWRLFAELIHVPLGVLGFVAACVVAVLLLKGAQPHHPGTHQSTARTATWLSPALIVVLLGLNLLNSPRPPLVATASASGDWTFPADLHVQPVQLRPGELDWLLRDGAESVTRVRFHWGGISGSLLLVPSRNWRAHHYPERCFENYGLRVEETTTHLVNNNLPVRFLTLTNGKEQGRLSATYWFQSASRVSDDYGTRLWSALSMNPERWVLVSVLFDAVYDPHAAELETLYLTLAELVQAHLTP